MTLFVQSPTWRPAPLKHFVPFFYPLAVTALRFPIATKKRFIATRGQRRPRRLAQREREHRGASSSTPNDLDAHQGARAPPSAEGVILSQPFFRFLGVSFDEVEDHDFEGPRSPKAHLDTVLTKPVTPPGHPLYISDLSTRSKDQDKRRLHPCTGLPSLCPTVVSVPDLPGLSRDFDCFDFILEWDGMSGI